MTPAANAPDKQKPLKVEARVPIETGTMLEIARFVVISSQSCMPANCWGKYRDIAVVEVDQDWLAELGRSRPVMISDRAQGVIRIVHSWERLHVGETARCAFAKAEEDADDLCAELNDAFYAANPDQLEAHTAMENEAVAS